MSHEITENDNVVLHKNSAWHGLGKVVADAPTPHEALVAAGMDWEVDQYDLSATLAIEPPTGTFGPAGIKRVAVPSHIANVRRDTGEVLGIVGQGWTPIQNREMADFCEALA